MTTLTRMKRNFVVALAIIFPQVKIFFSVAYRVPQSILNARLAPAWLIFLASPSSHLCVCVLCAFFFISCSHINHFHLSMEWCGPNATMRNWARHFETTHSPSNSTRSAQIYFPEINLRTFSIVCRPRHRHNHTHAYLRLCIFIQQLLQFHAIFQHTAPASIT